MFKLTALAAALVIVCNSSICAYAADDRDLAQMREDIRQMKQNYEARIQALEQRLEVAEALTANQAAIIPSAPILGNALNPAISAVLGGTYTNLSQDPEKFKIQGFMPGGSEVGPGARSFNLGESELTLSANIDPFLAGQLTFALTPENSAEVEEAFFQTTQLSNGFNLKGGRFLSSIGYLNSVHAHAWDFVDAPLVYQAFLGGQYKNDGGQLRWLAPTDRFFEVGMEVGKGANFSDDSRNKNGVGAISLFTHIGDDFNQSISWRLGLSYLHTRSIERIYADVDPKGDDLTNAFNGDSNLMIADGVLKWAPAGNATKTYFKLQGEYFKRRENGELTFDTLAQIANPTTDHYASAQSGWYLQGVYQFQPRWRIGLRRDQLYSGNPDISLVNRATQSAADFPLLSAYNPSRASVMMDYSPSEFSRFRVQFARDKSRADVTDHLIFLQYILNLGVHGAHTF